MTLPTTRLGRTGLTVSRLALGTMTFGLQTDEAVSHRILDTAADAGIDFLDTADVYPLGGTLETIGRTEEIIGRWLKARGPAARGDFVIATKAVGKVGPRAWDQGASRKHLLDAVDRSLARLQTDHVDLYQIHNFDPLTPMDDMLRSLDDAVRQGKVRHVGCSNLAAWQLTKALGVSERRELERFVSIQSYYSLAGRDIEHELVPAVRDAKLGLLCWSPLAGGLLSGKFDRTGTADTDARRAKIQFPPVDEARTFDIIDTLKGIAERHGASPAQVALAWLLSRDVVTSVIVGIKRPEQLDDNLGALELVLTQDDLAALDEVSRPPAAYPGWIQTYNAKARYPEGYPYAGPSWALGERPL